MSMCAEHIAVLLTPVMDSVQASASSGMCCCRYCEGYEATIRAAGGIDLQLLGMGRKGHIGFNESGYVAVRLIS